MVLTFRILAVPILGFFFFANTSVLSGQNKTSQVNEPPPVMPVVTAPPAQPDPCAVDKSRKFWQRVQCGEAPAYGAIGAIAGAICAAFIGFMAILINLNTVRGQRVHEQIRMVLEIDKELIACPQIWGIYDKPNPSGTPLQTVKPALEALAAALEIRPPTLTTVVKLYGLKEELESIKKQVEALTAERRANLLANLDVRTPTLAKLETELKTTPLQQTTTEALRTLTGALDLMAKRLRPQVLERQTSETELRKFTQAVAWLNSTLQDEPPVRQTVARALQSVTTGLGSLTIALRGEDNLTESELEGKKKALVFSYLNMFDYVHGFYARGFSRRILMSLKWWGRDLEEWYAWRQYMKYVFDSSQLTQNVWKDHRKFKMYPESFIGFINDRLPRLGTEEPW